MGNIMPSEAHQRAAEFHNSPHMRTVLPPHTTGKKITRPGTSIPSKPWNMPIKLSSGRKKLIGSP